MVAPGRLRELSWVAQKEELARTRRRSEGVRERHLAGLIDEQRVKLLIHDVRSKQPSRASDQLTRAGL